VAWYASPYWYGHESIDKAPWFSFGMSPSTVDVAFRTQKWSWDSIVSRQFFGALASAKSCAISCDDDSYNRIGDVWWYKQSRVGGLWLSLHEFTRLILQQTESAGCYCRCFFVVANQPCRCVSILASLAGSSWFLWAIHWLEPQHHIQCAASTNRWQEKVFFHKVYRDVIFVYMYIWLYMYNIV
jgi:hypothetical protein